MSPKGCICTDLPRDVSHTGLLGSAEARQETERLGTEASPIDAILVFSDSSNWYLDLQLMYDLISSGKAMTWMLAVKHAKSANGLLLTVIAGEMHAVKKKKREWILSTHQFVLQCGENTILAEDEKDSLYLMPAGGVVGRGEIPQDSKGLEVYFSNPDFVFANEFATPRFGQGALAIALKALLKEVSISHST